jgi:hypothetical protein
LSAGSCANPHLQLHRRTQARAPSASPVAWPCWSHPGMHLPHSCGAQGGEAPCMAHDARRSPSPHPHSPPPRPRPSAPACLQGVNIMQFCKEYNAATAKMAGEIIPVEITVYEVRGAQLLRWAAAAGPRGPLAPGLAPWTEGSCRHPTDAGGQLGVGACCCSWRLACRPDVQYQGGGGSSRRPLCWVPVRPHWQQDPWLRRWHGCHHVRRTVASRLF